MVFGRRVRPGWRQRVRSWLWPEIGLKRSALYILRRVSRLEASPHAIAAGFAAGAAVSFTPFIGFHFLMAFVLAWTVRGNLVAAALGTAVGNPLTFPLIFASAWEVGSAVLRLVEIPPVTASVAIAQTKTVIARGFHAVGWEAALPFIKTITVGSLPLGILAFAVFYVLVRSAVSGFQRARRARRAQRMAIRDARVTAGVQPG